MGLEPAPFGATIRRHLFLGVAMRCGMAYLSRFPCTRLHTVPVCFALSGVRNGVNLSQRKRMLSRLPSLRSVGVEAVKLLAGEGQEAAQPHCDTALAPAH
jgi:hypothetical protein